MILNQALAEQAKAKMNIIIEAGRAKAINGVQSIMDEYKIREDLLIGSNQIAYFPYENKIGLKDQGMLTPTNYAYDQLLSRIKMPKIFYNALYDAGMKEDWARDLLMENLVKLTFGNISGQLLFRIVGEQIKGILSNEYRRMDAGPIFETFIGQGINVGLVPCDGLNTPSKYHVKMLYPEVYEPVQGEVVSFGLSLTTSDYGSGALTMQMFSMRVFCTNLALGEDVLRKVHIGKRFTDELAFSKQTYELDTKAVASAVKDIVGDHFRNKIDASLKMIQGAAEKNINIDTALAELRNKGVVNKSQSETAKALYKDVDNIDMLPKQEGAWRFSNVLSLMANGKGLDGDMSLRLQEAANDVLKAA